MLHGQHGVEWVEGPAGSFAISVKNFFPLHPGRMSICCLDSLHILTGVLHRRLLTSPQL